MTEPTTNGSCNGSVPKISVDAVEDNFFPRRISRQIYSYISTEFFLTMPHRCQNFLLLLGQKCTDGRQQAHFSLLFRGGNDPLHQDSHIDSSVSCLMPYTLQRRFLHSENLARGSDFKPGSATPLLFGPHWACRPRGSFLSKERLALPRERSAWNFAGGILKRAFSSILHIPSRCHSNQVSDAKPEPVIAKQPRRLLASEVSVGGFRSVRPQWLIPPDTDIFLDELVPFQKQSPLNICPHYSEFDLHLSKVHLLFDYVPEEVFQIVNTGYTFQFELEDHAHSVLTAPGYLHDAYRLVQVHAHWGQTPEDGSEHRFDDQGYAAEFHFVHMKKSYPTFEEASKHTDGLAVIGILLEAQDERNPVLDEIVEILPKVQKPGDTAPTPKGFDFRTLLPEQHDFWSYEGSLTTPPFTECVIWTIFRHPIPISHAQLAVFRSLLTKAHEQEHHLVNIDTNVRPVQPRGTRAVRKSFNDIAEDADADQLEKLSLSEKA